MTINWETVPARRYVVVGFEGEHPRFLASEPGPAGFSYKRRRTWSPHLTDATLYTTLAGAEESLWKIITGGRQRLPKPIASMEVRCIYLKVGEVAYQGVNSI